MSQTNQLCSRVLVAVAAACLAACSGGSSTPPDAAAQVDAGPPDAALGTGQACATDSTCASGQCVDGVCCEAACDGPCMACNAASTGGSDGTCAPVLAATDPQDECAVDGCAPGTCDGAGACAVEAAEVVCRDAAGVCDVAEVCDGVAPSCPADDVASVVTVCFPSEGDCDIVDTCDGVGVDCPGNSVQGTDVECGNYRCTGTGPVCPASCTADVECALGNVCVEGGCTPGLRAFISSGVTMGNLGGLTGGDAFCQNLATAANLTGTYKAWLSDSTGSPQTRFSDSVVPYYLMNGATLASSFSDLTDGTIGAAFRINELGTQVAANVPFTGTTEMGLVAVGDALTAHCNNWTSTQTDHYGWIGNSEVTTFAWTRNITSAASARCSVNHRLFCVGQ